MNEQELLTELLRMHEAGESLSKEFATENYEGLSSLWDKRLICYSVVKMTAGNVRLRRVYSGVLRPAGVEKAKAIN